MRKPQEQREPFSNELQIPKTQTDVRTPFNIYDLVKYIASFLSDDKDILSFSKVSSATLLGIMDVNLNFPKQYELFFLLLHNIHNGLRPPSLLNRAVHSYRPALTLSSIEIASKLLKLETVTNSNQSQEQLDAAKQKVAELVSNLHYDPDLYKKLIVLFGIASAIAAIGVWSYALASTNGLKNTENSPLIFIGNAFLSIAVLCIGLQRYFIHQSKSIRHHPNNEAIKMAGNMFGLTKNLFNHIKDNDSSVSQVDTCTVSVRND